MGGVNQSCVTNHRLSLVYLHQSSSFSRHFRVFKSMLTCYINPCTHVTWLWLGLTGDVVVATWTGAIV